MEIGFRAEVKGELKEVLAVHYDRNNEEWLVCIDSLDNWVPSSFVSQYIGLRDKNGKKIYNGDILRGKYQGIGIVKFHNSWGSFYYSMVTGRDEYGDIVKMMSSKPFYNDSSEYEIIGNIFDNPELVNI